MKSKDNKSLTGRRALLLLLCPMVIAGWISFTQGIVKEVAAGEVRSQKLIVKDVTVEKKSVMTASSKRYQLYWSVEEIDEDKSDMVETGLMSNPIPRAKFHLAQNYPNPFNPSTTIHYEIPEPRQTGNEIPVRLNIYNLRGQLVRTLVDENKGSGAYEVEWDGTDDRGETVSSGVFLYRITVGDHVSTRKMTIIK